MTQSNTPGANVIREPCKDTWELLLGVCDDPDATTKDRLCVLRMMVVLRKMHGMEMLRMFEQTNNRREQANRLIAARSELLMDVGTTE